MKNEMSINVLPICKYQIPIAMHAMRGIYVAFYKYYVSIWKKTDISIKKCHCCHVATKFYTTK